MNYTHPDIIKAEIFGLPEPDIVGVCVACEEDICDYDLKICENCGEEIHKECAVKCHCGMSGCQICMLEDNGGDWICDTAETGNIEDSECYIESED